MRPWLQALAVASSVAVACTDPYEPEPSCTSPPRREPIDADSETHRFVIDSIHVATSATEAHWIGIDVDGDPQCRADNALGVVLATVLAWMDTDGNAEIADLVAAGRILHLLELRSPSLEEAGGASLRVYLGIDGDGDPTDSFGGHESFSIDPGISSLALAGEIRSGRLRADLGVVPLQIALPGVDEPFVLMLTAAKADITISPDGQAIEGRIGGAVLGRQVHDRLLPIAWTALARIIEADCPQGMCVPDSRGGRILDLFDDDADGWMALDEFRDNAIVAGLTSPDLDLFDERGRLDPRRDQVKDSSSFAAAFTAVPAKF